MVLSEIQTISLFARGLIFDLLLSVYALPAQFLALPAQAIQCQLQGLQCTAQPSAVKDFIKQKFPMDDVSYSGQVVAVMWTSCS